MSSTARVNAFADHATLTAYDDARWLDPGAALPSGDDWQRSDIAPSPSTERLVNLILPEGADLATPFWTLFEPALAAANGWIDCPRRSMHRASSAAARSTSPARACRAASPPGSASSSTR
jgi:hypothetical protein